MIDLKALQESIDSETMKKILVSLGFDYSDFRENDEVIIMPTYCHNSIDEEASHKLYYYKDSKTFHCFTECGETFSIFNLIMKMKKITFSEALNFLRNNYSHTISFENVSDDIQVRVLKTRGSEVELPRYSDSVLELFVKDVAPGWIEEGIGKQTLKKFNIRYCPYRNKIIIPHYDIDNNLVGIRGRALNTDELELGFKYMPIKVEKLMYKHPLGLNLYGLNLNVDNIRRTKRLVLFEGEKSVMKYDSIFGSRNNISLAICGYSLTAHQIKIIRELRASEVIIALDRPDSKGRQLYQNKIAEMATALRPYCSITIINSNDSLLDEKDSPIDKGKEVFIELFNKRLSK